MIKFSKANVGVFLHLFLFKCTQNSFHFEVVSNLTYHRMAMHEGVDTHTLRKALWNYIQCLYGIR